MSNKGIYCLMVLGLADAVAADLTFLLWLTIIVIATWAIGSIIFWAIYATFKKPVPEYAKILAVALLVLCVSICVFRALFVLASAI